ncbi:HAD family hydrolase [Oscillatoria sp. CS-180]|uniref:HAD family hydrolase n=1 Tax=Oscillatoria sp. CS-180 TaxID=3021720 RepID=UPI00232E0FDE|nr:HAD family hydrolase [Oscillatoria sp. CS-180]MDB9526320.1 HAD family hydrolase [Oscillatoria sp. CS-180]
MKDTVLIDFDGVLRHWSGTEIKDAETRLGLDNGTLFSWAFSQELLSPAITGAISHEKWSEHVHSKLAHLYGNNIASQLIVAWHTASWKIDFNFLQGLQELASTCRLVLATNATSRLDSDLKRAGLTSTFDGVVNSAQIGVAKPEHRFFEQALLVADSRAQNAVFIDDSLENVNAARSMGINSIHHRNVAETLEFIFFAIENRYYQELQ